jgi:hypothetical protein
MALYARDVLTGAMPGPYTDADADQFARLAIATSHAGSVCQLPRRRPAHRRTQSR